MKLYRVQRKDGLFLNRPSHGNRKEWTADGSLFETEVEVKDYLTRTFGKKTYVRSPYKKDEVTGKYTWEQPSSKKVLSKLSAWLKMEIKVVEYDLVEGNNFPANEFIEEKVLAARYSTVDPRDLVKWKSKQATL